MASVNYHKCKAGTGEAGALLRHCDSQERLKHEHSNEHINKDMTWANVQHPLSYSQTMARIRDRLADLDTQPGANLRKDRVELFMLEIPVPEGHDPEQFTRMALEEIGAQYGDRNIMGWYLHNDEVHEYYDHGQIKTSLAHIHVPVVPEIGGKLNGKAFSSKQQMQQLNRRIDERAKELGLTFLTGDPARKRSVEELKLQSFKELSEKVISLSEELTEARESLSEARREAERVRDDNLYLRSQNTALTAKNGELEARVKELDAALSAAREAAQQRKPKKRLLGKPVVMVPPEEWDAVRERAELNSHLGTLDLQKQALETRDMAKEIADSMEAKARQHLLEAQQQSRALLADAESKQQDIYERVPSYQLRKIREDFPEVDRCFKGDVYQGREHKQPEQGAWLRSLKDKDKPSGRGGR